MSDKAKLCAHAHTKRYVYRSKYVRESGVVCMDEPNIALVKFFLSSNVGTHRPTVFALSIVCAIIPYNPVTCIPIGRPSAKSAAREDLYPLIFLFSVISVASLPIHALAGRLSIITFNVIIHFHEIHTYVYIAHWFLMKANLFNIFA